MNSSRFTATKNPALLLCILMFAGFVLTACSGDGPGERVPLDRMGGSQSAAEELPAELQALLDAGNAAYRDREYERAMEHFEEVARLAPDLAAGWYGIGMTHTALGNVEAAESAMMEVHRLAPNIPLQHPRSDAPPNPHPASPSGTADGEPAPNRY